LNYFIWLNMWNVALSNSYEKQETSLHYMLGKPFKSKLFNDLRKISYMSYTYWRQLKIRRSSFETLLQLNEERDVYETCSLISEPRLIPPGYHTTRKKTAQGVQSSPIGSSCIVDHHRSQKYKCQEYNVLV
jgi:hypothetical protein